MRTGDLLTLRFFLSPAIDYRCLSDRTLVNTCTLNVRHINNIKIMPCVEGDRSDCQPEASSIARSRRLRAMVVVKG